MGERGLEVKSVEWGAMAAIRPHPAGPNSRVGAGGRIVDVRIARVTLRNGASGWGHSRVSEANAEAVLGRSISELLTQSGDISALGKAIEYPLWDLRARMEGVPTYRLAAQTIGLVCPEPLSVPCYDTSIYFDDLQSPNDRDGIQCIYDEVKAGLARGHRNCKVKIGRGARYMSPDAGMKRDIAVVHAVRQALGADGTLMVDANNAYNLGLVKYFLDATSDCNLFWMEEPFGEDVVLYGDLKQWMSRRNIPTLLADGEVNAPAGILDWVRSGYIDVLQFDFAAHGFSAWLRTALKLHEWGSLAAPHHYGTFYGNFAAAHLGVVPSLRFVEWDEADTPGVDNSLYLVSEGEVTVPQAPGFGLQLDEERFRSAVQECGFMRRC